MSITPEQYKALLANTEKSRAAPAKAKACSERHNGEPTPSRLTFPIDPFPAPRQSRSDAWKPSPRVLRYRAWKDRMRPMCAGFNWKLGDTLRVDFHVEMPKSWSKKKRAAMDGKPHQQKPDVDNFSKALMDLQGVDDGHVHTLHATKRWSTSGRIVVYVDPFAP
jgi:Holliday junction resolvase RusA-like endonuclease